MSEPGDAHDEPLGPINATQVQVLIDQLRDLAYVVYHRPPHDVDCAVSYEDGSSYYRVEIRWKTAPTSEPGSITDVDTFLRSLFNDGGGHR